MNELCGSQLILFATWWGWIAEKHICRAFRFSATWQGQIVAKRTCHLQARTTCEAFRACYTFFSDVLSQTRVLPWSLPVWWGVSSGMPTWTIDFGVCHCRVQKKKASVSCFY
uniref:Putative secreted protein n=1 Tax=Ixodes ricinus TaxID=34613 RepID=A0A6B0UK32_IXORI